MFKVYPTHSYTSMCLEKILERKNFLYVDTDSSLIIERNNCNTDIRLFRYLFSEFKYNNSLSKADKVLVNVTQNGFSFKKENKYEKPSTRQL